MKKLGITISIIAFIAIIGGGVWLEQTLNSSASEVADNHVALEDYHPVDQAAVKRGEYIMRLADCAACHTAQAGDFAGGYVFQTAFGSLVSSNITPDRETGIGNMTERQFFNAVRQGRGSKGFLYPAMPYTEYRKMSDQDVKDLWAYMSTIQPVKHAVDENGGMKFPYNIRLVMLGWDMLFFDNHGFKADHAQNAEWNRGAYIVDASGHCSACHTPRNALGAEETSAFLQGGNVGAYFAPDLTPDPHTGLGAWSIQNIVDYLKAGSNGTEIAAGAMAEAVQNSTQYMSDDDLKAVATYLKSLPPSPSPVPAQVSLSTPAMQQAALNFEVSCSACHGTEGKGMGTMVPAFAKSQEIMAPDSTNLIHALLVGGRAAVTSERPTGAGMPSFAWKFNNQQAADLLTYIRNAWGNNSAPVDPAKIAQMRKVLDAGNQLQASPN